VAPIARRQVEVVVLGHLALSGIEDENSNSEVRRFMKGVVLPLARRHGVNVYLIALSHSSHTARCTAPPRRRLPCRDVDDGVGGS
jgi:hypothetical protein